MRQSTVPRFSRRAHHGDGVATVAERLPIRLVTLQRKSCPPRKGVERDCAGAGHTERDELARNPLGNVVVVRALASGYGGERTALALSCGPGTVRVTDPGKDQGRARRP